MIGRDASSVIVYQPRAISVRWSTLSVQDCGMASYDLEDRLIRSRRDFIHKLAICLKELRETRTWLKFVREMDLSPLQSVDPVLRECDELLAILAASVRTARRNGGAE